MSLHIHDLKLLRSDGVSLLGPLSLNLRAGDRLGLVGESGSGKSLLVQALFGVLPSGVQQKWGSVEAFGVNMLRESPARDAIRGAKLSWIPQDPLQALNPFMKVKELLVLLPGIHRKEPSNAALARLTPLLERLRLPTDKTFLTRFPHQLSGGQRQRLVLAMALSCDPELLILDEPTTALDPTVQADFISLMLELQRERGLGYLWITHDLGVVASVCDRLLVIYGGEAMEAGGAEQILKAPRHPYTARLISAAKREPALESGFLAAPGERPQGCPFQTRCPNRMESCSRWNAWQGDAEDGLRCESPLASKALA
jgi:oligopeptide/dipeptide ABC transporter ATP-binding protein